MGESDLIGNGYGGLIRQRTKATLRNCRFSWGAQPTRWPWPPIMVDPVLQQNNQADTGFRGEGNMALRGAGLALVFHVR